MAESPNEEEMEKIEEYSRKTAIDLMEACENETGENWEVALEEN